MKVTILDYGAGNVPSVERALQRLGAETHRTSSPECISKAKALLLPGVGHYAALVRALDEKHLRAPLIDAIQRGVPFPAIWLGLQVLFKSRQRPRKGTPRRRAAIQGAAGWCRLADDTALPQ